MDFSSYFFNPHSVPLIIASTLILTMGILSITPNYRSRANIHFFFLCLSIFIWLTATAIGYSSGRQEDAEIWFKIDNFGVMFISPSFFSFSNYLVGKNPKKAISFGYLIAFLFGTLGLFSSYFVIGVKNFPWGFFPQWHLYRSVPFFAFWFGYSLSTFLTLWRAGKLSTSSGEKNRIKFVILAFSIAYLGSVDYFATFGFEIYPLGFIPILSLVSIIFYAIVKHRLLDFNLIMRWTLAYGTSFVFVGIFFSLLIFAFESLFSKYITRGIPWIFAACLVVLFFDPMRKRISKFVDVFVFKSPEFLNILSGIDDELRKTKTLGSIAEGLMEKFKTTWNVDHAGLALWNSSKSGFDLYPISTFKDYFISKFNGEIQTTDFLVRTLESERRLFRYGIIVDDELLTLITRASPGEKTTFHKIRRTMRYMGAAVCVPIMLKDRLMGIIILGPKKNKSLYNDEDKKFLSHVGEIVADTVNSLIISGPTSGDWQTNPKTQTS